jgi:probable HAF family extracellular repeat protein
MYLWQQVVNNKGHVAAYGNNAANQNAFVGDASFLWREAGDVEALPGLPGATDTIAFGINDRDEVVGASGAAVFSNAHAVLWENGFAHDLGTLPGRLIPSTIAARSGESGWTTARFAPSC